MDFSQPLPFFMAYPLPEIDNGQKTKLSDREYIRHLYPTEAKQYLLFISDVLDRIDFRENYLYDEYPDQVTLQRLTDFIMRFIPIAAGIPRETQRIIIQLLLFEELMKRREERNQEINFNK